MAKEATDVKKEDNTSGSESSATKDVDKTLEGLTEEQLKELSTKTDAELAETLKKDSSDDSSSGDETADETSGKHEQTVPYARFKEVNDQVRVLKQKVEQAAQASTKRDKPQTWDDLSLEELRAVRDEYREQGNTAKVDFMQEKIAERRARDVSKEQGELIQFNQARVSSWAQVVKDYPDLSNPESEHYRKTEELVESDKRFNSLAEGHAIAARLIAEQMLKSRYNSASSELSTLKQRITKATKRDQLESGGRGVSTGSSLDKLLEAAEATKNPLAPEWKRYFKAVEEKGKAKK